MRIVNANPVGLIEKRALTQWFRVSTEASLLFEHAVDLILVLKLELRRQSPEWVVDRRGG